MSFCKNLYLYTNVFEKLICFLMELEIICGYYKKKKQVNQSRHSKWRNGESKQHQKQKI